MNEDRNLHAHVETASVDCDGPLYRDHVEIYNEDELRERAEAQGINDFSEIHFRERVLLSCISVYSCEQGRLTVGDHGFDWHETTEEGHRSATVRWCWDDCDTDAAGQRDVYAEAMGY